MARTPVADRLERIAAEVGRGFTRRDALKRAAAAAITNPAVVVIGQVAALRDKMKWFDDQPLFGRRIVVTRPAHQAEDTAHKLRAKGAEPVMVPSANSKAARVMADRFRKAQASAGTWAPPTCGCCTEHTRR